MGHHHTPVEIDAHELQHSKKLWHNFTEATKYGVVVAVIILSLMAFFLV
jgi:hypothetical protein